MGIRLWCGGEGHGLAAGGGKVNAKECGGGDVLGANATRSGRVVVLGDWGVTFVSGGQKGERDGNLAGGGAGESAEQPIAIAAAGEGALVADGVVEDLGVVPDGRHVVEDGEFGRAVELRGPVILGGQWQRAVGDDGHGGLVGTGGFDALI